MSIRVLDFYTDGVTRPAMIGSSLLHDTLFCMMVELNGVAKELATTVPRVSNCEVKLDPFDFLPRKLKEYSVLCNFIESNKEKIKDKWNLTEKDYESLLIELELCLIDNYSDCDLVKQYILHGKGMLKKFINTLKWRFKKC